MVLKEKIAVIQAASAATRWPTAGRASRNNSTGTSALMITCAVTAAHGLFGKSR